MNNSNKSNTENTQAEQSLIFNNNINALMEKQAKLDVKKTDQVLTYFFDMLIRAEKKGSKIVQITLQIQFLSYIVQEFIYNMPIIMKGFTLLLGNCQQKSHLIKFILEQMLGDKIIIQFIQLINKLKIYEEEEYLNSLASFLKAYHRHFNEDTFKFYIEDERFLFLEICCKFFNCSEQITRTSITNILMTLLKSAHSSKYLQTINKQTRKCLKQWCLNMCRFFRNQLKNFDQQILVTSEKQGQYMTHLINDKIMLWQDLSEISKNLFSSIFYEQIILPLLIGSLNTKGIQLFTLKFSLYIITKLIKVITNMGLLNQLGKLLFTNQKIVYYDDQLETTALKSFNLKNILREQVEIIKQDQFQFTGINFFFINVLKSKDNSFFELACNLLFNLISHVRKSPQSTDFYIEKLGFGLNGAFILNLSDILINQFSAFHSLQTIQIIASLLLYIQPSKHLTNQSQNLFLHIFQNMVKQSIILLQKNKQQWPYIAEIFEYDAKILVSPNFLFQPELKKDSFLLFNDNLIDNYNLPFYKQFPQTHQNSIRYQLIKTFMLQKLSTFLIEECQHQIHLEKYVERVKKHDEKYIKIGQFVKLPIQCNTYRCKYQIEKILLPCLLLEDETNLILGRINNLQIRILKNIKIKHVEANFQIKKEENSFYIKINKFDQQNTQCLVFKNSIILKNLQVGSKYFNVKKAKIIDKQINHIFDNLRRCLQKIPKISLI